MYGEGELLCTSVYNPENDAKRFYWESNDIVLNLLKRCYDCRANIGYDLGWLYFHNYKEPLSVHLLMLNSRKLYRQTYVL